MYTTTQFDQGSKYRRRNKHSIWRMVGQLWLNVLSVVIIKTDDDDDDDDLFALTRASTCVLTIPCRYYGNMP